MKILISAGHTLSGKGSGAVGYLNESNENRNLGKLVYDYLKKAGHEVDYHEVNSGSDYINQQVNKANSKNYDLIVQIHFNSNDNSSAKGVEVLYRSSKGKVAAQKIQDKLKSEFSNRGIKHDINDLNRDLAWFRSTNPVAVLVETCFVSNKSDSEHYSSDKNKIAKLIAEGIHGGSINVNSSTSDPKPINNWVLSLQKELNKQGFRDSNGNKLSEDGVSGSKTLSACPTLKKDAKGNITKLLQEKLVELGYNTNGVDGVFGNGTLSAVKKYQSDKKLTADGVVGKNTWSKLLGL